MWNSLLVNNARDHQIIKTKDSQDMGKEVEKTFTFKYAYLIDFFHLMKDVQPLFIILF